MNVTVVTNVTRMERTMSKVEFYELESATDLKRVEQKINKELATAFAPAAPAVKLFFSKGEVVYSIQGLPVAGGKKVMDAVEKLVREEVGYRRGRPAGEPTHQVKTRVRETAYRALVKAAKKHGVSPSYLAREILEVNIA